VVERPDLWDLKLWLEGVSEPPEIGGLTNKKGDLMVI
jgi:hypothetical protein